MFTKVFAVDAFERIISTAAQALLGCLAAVNVDWGQKLSITGVAALAALLKAVVASQLGVKGTAALIDPAP